MKYTGARRTAAKLGLPPHGGSGLKLDMVGDLADRVQSPSTRREWIEIVNKIMAEAEAARLPPHGGSGLK